MERKITLPEIKRIAQYDSDKIEKKIFIDIYDNIEIEQSFYLCQVDGGLPQIKRI